jgi:peptide/nickel transport system permease protein
MTGRTAFVVRRLAITIPVLLAMSVVVFLMVHLVPGDPAQSMLGLRATPALLAQVRENLNLNDPLPEQFATWISHVVTGDLGTDYANGAPVGQELGVALPVTIELAVCALFVSGIGGVLLGVIAATRRGWRRASSSAVVVLGVAIPDFWMGIMLVLLFSATLAALPPSGYAPLSEGLGPNFRTFVLPVAALSLFQAAYFARTARAAMEEALRAPSITFLRAKGVRERSVVWRHALRNASVPIVTIVGLQFGAILGGAIVIETLFDLPGVGKLLYSSILSHQYSVVQGCVLVIATMFILVNLVTDLIIGWLDPRIGDGTAR